MFYQDKIDISLMSFSRRATFPQTQNRISALLNSSRGSSLLLDLTESNPTRAGLEYPKDLLESLARPSVLGYDPSPSGLASAREAVVDYYAGKSLTVEAGDIILTASTSEAYSWLFKLLADPGARVAVPRPGYPLFEHLAALECLAVDSYPLRYDGSWHIDLADLTHGITPDTRALICVSPNNPIGSFLAENEWDAMASLCSERSMGLILDEVFSDYSLDGRRDVRDGDAAETFGGPRERVASAAGRHHCLNFVLSGFSKVLCLPQMKLGWIVVQGPEPERSQARARLELIADTFLSVNTPVQAAAADWLRYRRAIQAQVGERLAANLGFLTARLRGSRCDLLNVEGGWSAVLRVPHTLSEEEWVLRLLEQDHVLVHPGYFYDFESEAYLIVSLLCSRAVFEEGIERLLRRVERDTKLTRS